MSEFTAEDYGVAEFARGSGGRRGVRTRAGWWIERLVADGAAGPFDDRDMASRPDWEPVSTSAADNDGRVTRLKRKIVELEDTNTKRKREIQALKDRVAELEEQAPVGPVPTTLDDMKAAWENAEVARECNKGDVMIYRRGLDRYGVYPAQSGRPVDWGTRILSRGPKREPWQDIADVLMEDRLAFEEDAGGIAKRLYERGVRVV